MNDNFCKTCVFSVLLSEKQFIKLPKRTVNLNSIIFKNIAKNISLLDTNEKKLYCTNEKNSSKDFVTGKSIPVLCDSLNYYGECLFHKTQKELDKEQEDKINNEEQNETIKGEPETKLPNGIIEENTETPGTKTE